MNDPLNQAYTGNGFAANGLNKAACFLPLRFMVGLPFFNGLRKRYACIVFMNAMKFLLKEKCSPICCLKKRLTFCVFL